MPVLPLSFDAFLRLGARQLSVSWLVTCDVTARRRLVSASPEIAPRRRAARRRRRLRGGGGGGGGSDFTGRPLGEVMSDEDVTCLAAAATDKWSVFSAGAECGEVAGLENGTHVRGQGGEIGE